MCEPSDATIDRLGDDVARLTSEADAVWAVLDAAGIDVQLGVDTLADGVGKLAAELDEARSRRDFWANAYAVAADGWAAAAEVLRGLRDAISDWEDGADV
jgi:hypothetical protein